MYGSRDKECDGQNFLTYWTIFCPFTPLKTWKIKILKKWKTHLKISSFYTNVPIIMIIYYTVPEIQQCWPQSIIGDTVHLCYCKFRLVTCKAPLPPEGLRGWKFLILITPDSWKRHFWENNYIELFINTFIYILKPLLKNV